MKEIPLTGKHGKGLYVIVDDDVYEWAKDIKWNYHLTGKRRSYYPIVETHTRTSKKSNHDRVEYFIMGSPLYGMIWDHINGNSLDARRENLRLVTARQNKTNKGVHPNSSSQYIGVKWRKAISKWEAAASYNYKDYYCGLFDSEVEAAKARDKKAYELHGEFVRLNFPLAE